MSNPIVSLYASAARPENWKKLYDSVKYNKCEFEIVFVGPNAPKDPLPSEFKFIQSYTKPVQCAEIAARNTKGVFLLHCVDDLEFKDKNALDVMIAEYDRISGEAILSPKLMRDGNPFPEDNYKLFPMSENCPPIPISLFMKRSVFESLGGYDVNFIASFADTDIAFRALSQRKARIDTMFDKQDHRSRFNQDIVAVWLDMVNQFKGCLDPETKETLLLMALRFCLSFSGIVSVIPGTLSQKQVLENVEASNRGRLSDKKLEELAAIYRYGEQKIKKRIELNKSNLMEGKRVSN